MASSSLRRQWRCALGDISSHYTTVYLKRLLWLCSATCEWQSLEHLLHLNAAPAEGWSDLLFLFARLLSARCRRFSSSAASLAFSVPPTASVLGELFPCLCNARAFKSGLQTSLKRSVGRPLFLLPEASSAYRMSLVILPSSMAQPS
jgi:hypothetical protein